MDTCVQVAGEGMGLHDGDNGLALIADGMELQADFEHMLPRLRPDRLARELLVRAARLRDMHDMPVAVDATAGLGEDALLLAAAGFSVRLYERERVLAALLADGLERARASSDVRLAAAAQRMDLRCEDSVAGLRALAEAGERVDAVLLDPMFPAKRKEAATKKKLQVIRRFERPCSKEEETALLSAALGVGARKVVVKRPLKGPVLAGRKPSYQLCGKVVRYDVYVG